MGIYQQQFMDALTISPEWLFNMALRTARVWQVILFMCVCCCSIGVQAMTCSVTQPNGNTPPGEQPDDKSYGNGKLWTVLWWTNGSLTYPPGEPGIILPDGSLQVKVGWFRGAKGKLTIEGRRSDSPGPPLRAWIPEGYGDLGFQATGVIFPTPGCWEVTGRVQETRLTFVVNVVRHR